MEKFMREMEDVLQICIKAHLEKKRFAKQLMSGPSMPLWQIGKPAADGRPYVDLDAATYIVGIIGLNEALQYLTGKELHEDEEALRLGLKIISHLFFAVKEEGKKQGIKITIEESPAESASRRLAKIDMKRYPQAAKFVRGSVEKDEVYYTNSVHLRPDADVDIVERIRKQAKFHSLIESGAIIHAFVGENRPSAGAIESLVKKTFENTQAAQLTISPEFTICKMCHRITFGVADTCQHCGAQNLNFRRDHAHEDCCTWSKEGFLEFEALHRAVEQPIA